MRRALVVRAGHRAMECLLHGPVLTADRRVLSPIPYSRSGWMVLLTLRFLIHRPLSNHREGQGHQLSAILLLKSFRWSENAFLLFLPSRVSMSVCWPPFWLGPFGLVCLYFGWEHHAAVRSSSNFYWFTVSF